MVDFKAYESHGLLKKSDPDFRQISRQINRAILDMRAFSLVVEADPEWAATIAYQAMLRTGRALIYSYGYLPADGQRHKTVVEITGALLGRDYEIVTRQFERFRKKRNVFFYESTGTGTTTDAVLAAETAKKLIRAVRKNISLRKIQLESFADDGT